MAGCTLQALVGDSVGSFSLYPMETSMRNCVLLLASTASERACLALAHLLLLYSR